MRTITKLQTLLVLFLTTAMIGFVGCKDDDGDVPGPTPGNEATYANRRFGSCIHGRIVLNYGTLK